MKIRTEAHRKVLGALRLSSAMAGILLVPGVAWASCSPNPTQTNATTTCSGPEGTTLVVGSNGANVVVESGAIVSAASGNSMVVTSQGLPSGAFTTYDSNIAINGTISNATNAAILVTTGAGAPGSFATLTTRSAINVGATGVISGPIGIDLTVNTAASYSPRSEVTLVNSGTISSSNGGYALRGNATATARFASVTNTATGTIGAISGQVGTLTNQGLIDGGALSAFADAAGSLQFFGQGVVANSGTIRSNSNSATLFFTRNFNPGNYVENSGLISNSGSGSAVAGQTILYALNQATGSIVSNGVALYAPSYLSVDNRGTITGGGGTALASNGSVQLINRGTINGNVLSGSTNPNLASMIDNVGGTINGNVLLGGGNDVFIGDTANLANPIGTINGTVDAGGGIDTLRFTFLENRTLDSAITLPQTIERLELLIGGGSTLTLSDSFAGSAPLAIGGGDPSFYNPKNQFINNGRIIATGPALVSAGVGGIGVTNNGTISAALANSATFAVDLSQITTFTNSGTISASGGGGVRITGGNGPWQNSGTITADGTAVMASQVVTNSGTIRSTAGIGLDLSNAFQGVSANSGTIEGATAGARVYYSRLQNSGTISSARAGIEIGINGVVENLAGGTINGGIKPSAQGFVTQGAKVANAGVINGGVDFGTPTAAQATSNIFVALRGGIVNGDVVLGGGGDIFATLLVNTGTGEFAGITGAVRGNGQETLRYIVDADASATPELRGIFSALGYDLSNGAKLTLASPNALTFGLGFSGAGSVDLSADLAGKGVSPILNLRQISVQTASDGTTIPTALDFTSRGTLTLAHDQASITASPAVALGAGSTFTNAGTIIVRELVNGGSRPLMAIGSGGIGATIVNTGTISLDGAVGIGNFYADGGLVSVDVTNSGTIAQLAGGARSFGIIGATKVNNSGLIQTQGAAVQLNSGQLINSGTITSTGAQAIMGVGSSSPGQVSNVRGGVINGGVGYEAILLGGGSVVSNAGTINGNVRLADNFVFSSALGSVYVNAGGTLNGNLVMGSGNDIFVSSDGATGVTGSIDAGSGIDTFVRSYSTSTTATIGGAASLPTGFENEGVGARGKDTVVTVTSSGGVNAPLRLIGDGSIVNMANILASNSPATPNLVSLGLPNYSDTQDAVYATLAFTNRASLGDGVAGFARSFANEGTITSSGLYLPAVSISASSAETFEFSNSGTISKPNQNGDAIAVSILHALGATPIDAVSIANGGTINGRMTVQARTSDFSWTNSGVISTSTSSYPSVSLSVGQTDTYYSEGFNATRATIANSGTLNASLSATIAAQALQFSNSGTIGSASSGLALSVTQTARPTGNLAVGSQGADQDSAGLVNSGTINGGAAFYASAPLVTVSNTGTILVGPTSQNSLLGQGAFVLNSNTLASQVVTVNNEGVIAADNNGATAFALYASAVSAADRASYNGLPAQPDIDGPTASVQITNSGTIRAGGATYLPAISFPYYSQPETLYLSSAISVDAESSGIDSVAIANQTNGVISITHPTFVAGGDSALSQSLQNVGATAIRITADRFTLDNAGKIEGMAGGSLPEQLQTYSANVSNAPGTYMAGAIQTFGSTDTILNRASGTITGSIDLGDKDDVLQNYGTINGDVFLGDGNDRMIHNIGGGRLTGKVDGGAGTDSLVIDIAGGGLLDQALLNRFVNFESQVVSGTGTVTTNGAFTQDSLILRDANFTLAAGQTLQTASNTAIVFDGGTNMLVNLGTIVGGLDLRSGSNTVVNQGRIGGALTFGSGDDRLVVGAGAVFSGPVDGGAGNDLLLLAGGGSDAAPAEIDLSRVTGFERTRLDSGTFALSGTYSTNALDVAAGRLIGRAGSTLSAGTITVASGATFGSAGTVNGNIAVNGTLSPGASPGTMTVNGSVALAGGSKTLFEMTPTVSDALVINGALTIASGASLTLTGTRPLTPGTAYHLITASGGITGSFSTIDKASTVLGFVRQSSNSIDLLGQFMLAAGASPQASRTVTYLNDLLVGGTATAGLLNAVPLLVNSSGMADPATMARLNAEPYASASQISIENGLAVAAALRSANRGSREDAVGLFAFGQALSAWRDLPGSSAEGTSRANISMRGGFAGIGASTGKVSIGGFVGYIDARQRIGALGAKNDTDGVLAGLIGQADIGNFGAIASITYDGSSADTERSIPGNIKARSHYRLRGWTADLALGYAFAIGNGWTLRPEAGLTHILTRRGAASESGGALALNVDRRNDHATFVSGSFTLGGRADAPVRPWLSAGVRHQLDGSSVYASAAFAGVAARLTVPGADRNATLASVSGGVAASISKAAELFVGLNGEFGADSSGKGGNLGVRLRF